MAKGRKLGSKNKTHKSDADKELTRKARIARNQAYKDSQDIVDGNALDGVVLRGKRAFKLNKNATSKAGANDMISRWNKMIKDPTRQFHVHAGDYNKDNIEDIIICRGQNTGDYGKCRGTPRFVNGWTTKKSNYPLIHNYYSSHPTKDSRKLESYTEYVNSRALNGKRTKSNGYKQPKLNQYQYFVQSIFSPLAKIILDKYEITYDVKVTGPICKTMWENYVTYEEELIKPAKTPEAKKENTRIKNERLGRLRDLQPGSKYHDDLFKSMVQALNDKYHFLK